MFCEMGHWYPWATPNYILKKMSLKQFLLYYKNIPMEGRIMARKKDNKPDYDAIERLMKGRKVVSR